MAGRSLTEILVGNGDISEDALAHTLAEHHHLDHIDLDCFAVDPAATALIEPDVARRLGAVPIAFLPSGAAVVALHEPNGSTAALELARLTGRAIQPAVASRSQIEALIGTLRRARRSTGAAPAARCRPLPPGGGRERRRRAAARAHGTRRRRLAGRAVGRRGRLGGSLGPSERRRTMSRSSSMARSRRCASASTSPSGVAVRPTSAPGWCRARRASPRPARRRPPSSARSQPKQLIDAAEARAEAVSAAAVAANEMLSRLLRACEVLERQALPDGDEVVTLRDELDAERARSALLADRIAELEAQLGSGGTARTEPHAGAADGAPSAAADAAPANPTFAHPDGTPDAAGDAAATGPRAPPGGGGLRRRLGGRQRRGG